MQPHANDGRADSFMPGLYRMRERWSPACLPLPGMPAEVDTRHDPPVVADAPEVQPVGKAPEQTAPKIAMGERKQLGIALDGTNSVVDRCEERLSDRLASGSIPAIRFSDVAARGRPDNHMHGESRVLLVAPFEPLPKL